MFSTSFIKKRKKIYILIYEPDFNLLSYASHFHRNFYLLLLILKKKDTLLQVCRCMIQTISKPRQIESCILEERKGQSLQEYSRASVQNKQSEIFSYLFCKIIPFLNTPGRFGHLENLKGFPQKKPHLRSSLFRPLETFEQIRSTGQLRHVKTTQHWKLRFETQPTVQIQPLQT